MARRSDVAARATEGPRRFHFGEFLYRVGKVLFVAVLFLLFYALSQDMVRHRFFRGERYHHNGALGQ